MQKFLLKIVMEKNSIAHELCEIFDYFKGAEVNQFAQNYLILGINFG